jgi:hypothetical protein
VVPVEGKGTLDAAVQCCKAEVLDTSVEIFDEDTARYSSTFTARSMHLVFIFLTLVILIQLHMEKIGPLKAEKTAGVEVI